METRCVFDHMGVVRLLDQGMSVGRVEPLTDVVLMEADRFVELQDGLRVGDEGGCECGMDRSWHLT